MEVRFFHTFTKNPYLIPVNLSIFAQFALLFKHKVSNYLFKQIISVFDQKKTSDTFEGIQCLELLIAKQLLIFYSTLVFFG